MKKTPSASNDWQDFFVLLRSLFTKEETDIKPTDRNFNPYLVRRYISFYHPAMLEFMVTTINDTSKFNQIYDSEIFYKSLKAMMPRLPFNKITYIKKPVSTKLKPDDDLNDKVARIANYMEISRREVLEYIAEINQNEAFGN